MNDELERPESNHNLLTVERPPAQPPVHAPAGLAKPPLVPRRPAMTVEEDDESFFQRHQLPIIFGVIALLGGGWAVFHKPSAKSEPVRKAPEMTVRISLPPPPPPPPPPPKVQPPPPKEKAPELAPVDKPIDKPVDKPKPAEKPPEGLGTSIRGVGPGMGLGYGSGNGIIGGTGKGGGGGGSVAAWYAGQVQSRVAEALRNHPSTRKATIKGLKFSLSLDGTGRVTSARLLDTTGDAALDAAIRDQILPSVRLQEPPPGGKPMTVTLRLNAQPTVARPN